MDASVRVDVDGDRLRRNEGDGWRVMVAVLAIEARRGEGDEEGRGSGSEPVVVVKMDVLLKGIVVYDGVFIRLPSNQQLQAFCQGLNSPSGHHSFCPGRPGNSTLQGPHDCHPRSLLVRGLFPNLIKTHIRVHIRIQLDITLCTS